MADAILNNNMSQSPAAQQPIAPPQSQAAPQWQPGTGFGGINQKLQSNPWTNPLTTQQTQPNPFQGTPWASQQTQPNPITLASQQTRLNPFQGTPWASQQTQPNPWTPPPPNPTTFAPITSVEQYGLGGGGNPQQIQNFMSALNNVGAGSNNAMMNAPPQQAAQATNLYNGGPANTNQAAVNTGSYNPQTGGYSGMGDNNQSSGMSAQFNNQQSGNNIIATTGGGLVNGANANNQSSNMQQLGNIQQTASGMSNPQFGNMQQFGNQQLMPATNNPASIVSDEKAKQNIEDSGKRDMTDFLSKVGAHSYEYKDPKDNSNTLSTTYTSPMAQELAKTELGKSAVEKRPDGKLQINYGRLSGVMLSAMSTLHDRLSQLEKK